MDHGFKAFVHRALWLVVLGGGAGLAYSVVHEPIQLEPEEQDERVYGPAVDGGTEPHTGLMPEDTGGEAEAEGSSSDPAEQAEADVETPAIIEPADPRQHASETVATGEPDCDDLWVFEADITLAQARCAWQTGEFTFFDARPTEEFEAGHVAGAVSTPPDAFNSGDPEALILATPDMPVIVYCVGGECSDAKAVVIELQQRGYDSVHIMTAGYPAWEAAGYDIETGPDMFSAGE